MRTLLWSVLASISALMGGGSTAFAATPVATAEASDALVTDLRPDIAIVQFNAMMTMGQGKEPLGRTLLLVASREADGWKIAAGQLTKPNCP